MRIDIRLCWILFFLGSCSNKSEKQNQITGIPIDTITWANFRTENIHSFPPMDVVKAKKYIKLDFSSSYLFGGADKVLFLDRIYVLDKRLKKIVIFSQEGKGEGVLHNVGQGPEEYLQITDFGVDIDGNICLIDGVSDRLMIYNAQYEFIASEKLPFEADIIQCLDNGDFLMGLSTWNTHPETAGKRLVVCDRNFKIKETYLDFDEYTDESYWISFYTFATTDDQILYHKPIDDYIYTLSNDGALQKAFYINFGSNRIPLDWRKDIELNIDQISEGYTCLKNHAVITDSYMFGTLWDRTTTRPFLLNRKKNIVYVYNNIAESDVSDIVDFKDNGIISLIYPGKYDLTETDFPADVQRHFAMEGYVICVTILQ